jgi:hypothetical protein
MAAASSPCGRERCYRRVARRRSWWWALQDENRLLGPRRQRPEVVERELQAGVDGNPPQKIKFKRAGSR